MRRSVPAALLIMAASVVVTGCEEHGYEPPDRTVHVAKADSAYDEVRFDTLSWSSAAERIAAGNLVYADECRRCHGPTGEGGTEYAVSRQLDVPSLVAPDWEYGDDLDAVRRRVYTGHPDGMPTWGVGRLTERQVDAVAYYLVEQLRKEFAGS
jgi:mono/diheme cytochrome c family protein